MLLRIHGNENMIVFDCEITADDALARKQRDIQRQGPLRRRNAIHGGSHAPIDVQFKHSFDASKHWETAAFPSHRTVTAAFRLQTR